MNTIEMLKKLTAARPVTSDICAVNRAQTIVRDELEKNGILCTMERLPDGHEVLFASTVPGKTPDYLLNAHLDVVPAIDESQYEPVIDGDCYIARGSCDCHGNAVCIMNILIRAKAEGRSVGAVFTGDEEDGGNTTAAMVGLGYCGRKAVLIMDVNMDNGIAIAQKGICILKLTASGRGGHSAVPWGLDNPIDRLVRGYAKLLDAWRNPDGADCWHDTMAACQIQAGFANNQVPDTAEMIINFRFVSPDGLEKIPEMVRNITGLQVEVVRSSRFADASPDDPQLTRLLEILKKTFSDRSRYGRQCGATDARHFVGCGVPFCSIGVAGGGAHGRKEWVSLSSIRKYEDVVCEFIAG